MSLIIRDISECPICGARFPEISGKRKASLSMHIRKAHQPSKKRKLDDRTAGEVCSRTGGAGSGDPDSLGMLPDEVDNESVTHTGESRWDEAPSSESKEDEELDAASCYNNPPLNDDIKIVDSEAHSSDDESDDSDPSDDSSSESKADSDSDSESNDSRSTGKLFSCGYLTLFNIMNSLFVVDGNGDEDEAKESRKSTPEELKNILDDAAVAAGVKHVEQLMFIQLIMDIGGTEDRLCRKQDS